ncbi:MAG: sigma 54-interacting transcriptional regulator [Planctomycetota bacterium]
MTPHLSPLARAVLDSDYDNVRVLTRDSSSQPSSRRDEKSYRAIRDFVDSLEGMISPEKALSTLREALEKPPDDLELLSLILGVGVWLSSALNRAGDAKRFSDRMEETTSETTANPELHSYWLVCEAGRLLNLALSDNAKDLFKKALSRDIPRDTAFWIRLKISHMKMSCFHKDISTAGDIAFELHPLIHRHPRFQDAFRLAKVYYYRATGNTNEALALIATLRPPHDNSIETLYLRFHLLFDAGRWEDFERELAALEKSPHPPLTPCRATQLRSLKALGQGFPEKAGALAREALSQIQPRDNPHRILLFAVWILSGAELSLRNPKTARHLLEMQDPGMTRMDCATLWMRIFLLEKNEPQAALFLKRLLDIGEGGRLYLASELREATEVSAHQIEKLHILASKIPSEPKPASDPSNATFDASLCIVGESPAIRKAKTLIRKLAPLPETVLVTGETGTGKDIVSRLLHQTSPRASHPFVAVNCTTISDSLMEAELFGYVKGAFTGASRDHDGLFTTAGKGTLFLDEVESMPARLQAGLLRVLESGEIRPVGGTRIRKATARIVAATNVPLEKMVKQGTFREDLFYRLARFEIRLPPLRERWEDIPHLARYFLGKIYASGKDEAPKLGDDLIEALQQCDWPGNVRELENKMRQIEILAGDRRVWGADLFRPISSPSTPPGQRVPRIRTSTLERRDKLRALFSRKSQLTFQEVVDALQYNLQTALFDLRALESEGAIRRVLHPSGKKTLYYTRAE